MADTARVRLWPYGVGLVVTLALVGVAWWLMNAPIPEPANPNTTPNPSHAPWFALAWSDAVAYAEPWLVGVVLPLVFYAGPLVAVLLVVLFVQNWKRRGLLRST